MNRHILNSPCQKQSLILLRSLQYNFVTSMLYRQRLDPNIQAKYHQINAHMTDKNKVIQQFTRILRDLCDWQMLNSRNLEKLSNQISKLLVDKDPLNDLFTLFQRILSAKSQQANRVAESIQEDMLPFLQKATVQRQQDQIRLQQMAIRQSRKNMQQKIRQLYWTQANYKRMIQNMKALNTPSTVQSHPGAQEITKAKKQLLNFQAYFSQVINVYNLSVQDYMLSYMRVCEQHSQVQTNRKTRVKQSISKFIVFEMDAVKNIEYDLCRHAKSIEMMDDSLITQDKYQHSTDIKKFRLSKISSKNYIAQLNQSQMRASQQLSSIQTDSQRKLSQIRRLLDPSTKKSQIQKQSQTSLIADINELLTQAIQAYDIKIVKKIVSSSSDFYMPQKINRSNQVNHSKETLNNVAHYIRKLIFSQTKIPLLNVILGHPIFENQVFWEKYDSQLNDLVQSQIIKNNVRQNGQMELGISILSSDIEFMKRISSLPIIERILLKYIKYTMDLSQPVLKSTDSTQSVCSKNRNKQKEKAQKQIIQQNTSFKDVIYF